MLYRSTDRLCRSGAPMENLCHSASFESDEKNAPSKSGTKQLENSIGAISAFYAKDPTDPRWKDDAYTREFIVWQQKYYPRGKPNDIFVAAGYNFAQPLVYLLTQCGDDLSRENIMRQATSLHDVSLPWLLPR